MTNMHDARASLELEKMSLVELQELHDRIHKAIRAEIGRRNAARSGAVYTPKPDVEEGPKLDLARERDAWLARKRAGG